MIEAERGSTSSSRHPIATVAAGDFNAWSADVISIRETRKHFPHSPAENGLPTRGAFPTDFIFFREAAKGSVVLVENSFRRIESAYRSDHHPLIAWFKAAD